MRRPLDPVDCQILEALQRDARLSNKELAARVSLAPSSCLERVRRLREDGILKGSHSVVDPHALGIGLQAMIAIRLRAHIRADVAAFQEHALGVREVVAIYHVTGANDFLVHVAVRDADHLREVALGSFTTRPEVVHMETSLIFERVSKGELPILLDE